MQVEEGDQGRVMRIAAVHVNREALRERSLGCCYFRYFCSAGCGNLCCHRGCCCCLSNGDPGFSLIRVHIKRSVFGDQCVAFH